MNYENKQMVFTFKNLILIKKKEEINILNIIFDYFLVFPVASELGVSISELQIIQFARLEII